MDKAVEWPDFCWSSDTAGDRDLTAEDPEHSDDFKSAMTEVEDSVGPRWDAAERRAAPRIRTLLRIAKITSVTDSGLCCLRSISDSGLMDEDRNGVVSGNSVSVRVALVGRTHIKKKNNK